MPSRNEPCPCGSGTKFKRCCLPRLDAVGRELRERDALLGDVVAWVQDEHAETLDAADEETRLIRLVRGRPGRNMSLVWALNDFRPPDGGPPLMTRFAERAELGPQARERARGLAEARLDAYRVCAVGDLVVELESLTAGGDRLQLGCRDGLDQLEVGDILVARLVRTTTIPTVWGLGVRFGAEGERRWRARLAALPSDPADAALGILGFHPDDVAEPLEDGLELVRTSWLVYDHDAILEILEADPSFECIGEALPSGWAFSWLEEAAAGGCDLGGWREGDGDIEVARLVVGEREMALVSADRRTLAPVASHLDWRLCGVIAPGRDAVAA